MGKSDQILRQYINKSKFYSDLKIAENYFKKLSVEMAILTKQDIQTKSIDILNSDYHNLDINALKVARTSGSTGQPLEVFWSSNEMMRSNLCLWRLRKKYYNIFPNSKCASFHSILYNQSIPMDAGQIEILNNNVNISFSKFFLEENDIRLYLQEMERFGVEWLLIQPSIAQKLYDYLNTSGTKLPPKIKYIELNGENISKVTEKKFKDFFEVNVANLYGANEVNAIAYECPFGHMHILEDNVLVQLYNAEIKGKETSGNIVVSSLTNSVFPIIGYDLGDKVCVENLSCPCGNPARVIKEIYGRKTDEIEVNGKSIDPFCLTYCVENINSRFGNPIRQFKVVFSNNELTLLLEIYPNYSFWKESISTEIIKLCKKMFRMCVPIKVEFASQGLSLNHNGKFGILERR
mgnify:FL=1